MVVGALGLFVTLLAFLVIQMRTGGDPALGAGTQPTPRRVHHARVHRVVRRTAVVQAPVAPPSESDDEAPQPSAPAAPQPSAPAAPATPAAPPAAAAPPPAPVPAPQPPPAPVVTRAS